MRIDVREQLEEAARAEREFNGNSIILISDEVRGWMEQRWSPHVQLAADRMGDSPFVEITVKETGVEDILHNTRRMLQALDLYWKFYEQDGDKMERWWTLYERYRNRVDEGLSG